MKLSAAQRTMLERMTNFPFGYSPLENNFGTRKKVCEGLVTRGLAEHYVHGGFVITDAGRQALQERI